MKDPAFLFYPGDYLSGTMGMTFEQKGAYVELLIAQFHRGHMTSHMIGQILGQKYNDLWPVIGEKFKLDQDGKYYNERLDIEKSKRSAYCGSRKNNRLGINQYTKKTGHMTSRMTSHMENVNENNNNNNNSNSNSSIYNIGGGVGGDDYIYLQNEMLNSAMWIEQLANNYNVSVEKVAEYIPEFVARQRADYPDGRELNELKRHYNNYLGRKLRMSSVISNEKSRHKIYKTIEELENERIERMKKWTPPVKDDQQ